MEPRYCEVRSVGSDQTMFLGYAVEEKGNLIRVGISYNMPTDDITFTSGTIRFKAHKFIFEGLWFHRSLVVFP